MDEVAQEEFDNSLVGLANKTQKKFEGKLPQYAIDIEVKKVIRSKIWWEFWDEYDCDPYPSINYIPEYNGVLGRSKDELMLSPYWGLRDDMETPPPIGPHSQYTGRPENRQ